MTPYYDHGGITIWNADCRAVLPGLGEVGAIVTDPPYGHGKDKWSGGTWATNPIYEGAKQWDRETVDGLEEIIAGYERAIVWGGNYYRLPPSRCWLAWIKTSLMDTMADFELAWTNLDRPSKMKRENRNPDGKRWHPTQKPLSVMKWCLHIIGDGTILDPFMGSGTTLVAAKELGRRAIGVEVSEEYCRVAVKRLQQEVLSFGKEGT